LERKKGAAENALKFAREAASLYDGLKRIPQYIEASVEYLKVIHLCLEKEDSDKEALIKLVPGIRDELEKYVVGRTNLYEPEYCYLMGMILGGYTDAERANVLEWFSDAVSLSKQYNKPAITNISGKPADS